MNYSLKPREGDMTYEAKRNVEYPKGLRILYNLVGIALMSALLLNEIGISLPISQGTPKHEISKRAENIDLRALNQDSLAKETEITWEEYYDGELERQKEQSRGPVR